MRVLCVNAGSSSLKLSLLGDDDELLEAGESLTDAMREQADAVAHRVVHGGDTFTTAVRVDAGTVARLRDLSPLAPLHGTKAIEMVEQIGAQLPHVPAVACFDTAFHATLPDAAATYALPARWRERWPLRRFGFHGLSHAWIARRVPELLGRPVGRIVSCHLGAGASLCAIADGRSVDTTMGFTPLEGLVMATRSGSVDPGLLLWLLEQTGMRERELAHALEHESGLLALAGSADMRDALAQDGLAVRVYVHRLRAAVAAMAAALGGVDAIAFTGGVGESSHEIRARAAAGLAFLGIALVPGEPDADITAPGASVAALVIRAREDLEMARQARATLEA